MQIFNTNWSGWPGIRLVWESAQEETICRNLSSSASGKAVYLSGQYGLGTYPITGITILFPEPPVIEDAVASDKQTNNLLPTCSPTIIGMAKALLELCKPNQEIEATLAIHGHDYTVRVQNKGSCG